MKLSNNPSNDTIVASISREDILKRTESGVIDLICTRLADKFIQDNADRLLIGLINEVNLKKEVEALIKLRITDETITKIQKS